ncbi:O-Glycosyl hydrolase [Sedimentisphaera cyanobacteriorum]|uniref:galactosylceramidase n=1 Tax=Sedimentisphaera cyanobacteriorum TaxID=1940790 RepID=A0A1Q2HRG5_9BACT|nr:discoidin domain-containing protein [Sedimentisphaera cyanobacteriorum]AQQ09990.1 O-Glycosyl hydrolase [Sedimentisphaera cyanobacteriorum]
MIKHISAAAASLLVFLSVSLTAATVNVNSSSEGRTFDGMGAWSSGGNSRLLIDYEEPCRSDILDMLFKPNFGASLQHFRVEIGSSFNSTSGAEPSHAITRDELNDPVSRGYEFWLMKEAQDRNPNIVFDCMLFAFPYWFTEQFSQDTADYITAFLDEAKNEWGVELDWITPTKTETIRTYEEIEENLEWCKNTFIPTMNRNSYDLNILLLDGGWWAWRIFEVFESHPEYESIVDACGGHNIDQKPPHAPCSYPPKEIIDTGKKLWSSGDTAGHGSWGAATGIVERMNRLYIKGRITNMQVWNVVDGCAEGVNWTKSGLIKADQPWSNHYEIYPAVWGVAHYTQFTEVGWKYLNDACGYLSGSGNYATLKDPDSDNWSTIIYSENPETIKFNLTGVSADTVHVWRTTSSSYFVKLEDIKVTGSSFTLNTTADAMYSITTTAGQQKGQPAHEVPSYETFPMPYSEDFENYEIGATAKYLSDMQGTFETAECKGDREGLCLEQIVPEVNETYLWWPQVNPSAAMSLFGEMSWRDYELNADIYIEDGFVYIGGRKGDHQVKSGYCFVINKQGDWKITYDDVAADESVIESGSVSGFDGSKWHNLKIRFINDEIRTYLDSKKICEIEDSRRKAGQCCFGSSFDLNQFDNLIVKPIGRWSMVDEKASSVYSWGWNSFNNSELFGGSAVYNDQIGEMMSFSFLGQGFRIFGSKRTDGGIADIYLGQQKIDSVDCYNPDREMHTLLYVSDDLSFGYHNAGVLVSEQKNPSSSSNMLVIDAFAKTEIPKPVRPEPKLNLALGAVASASSSWGVGYGAEEVNDGDSQSRWNSGVGDVSNSWLLFEFPEKITFGKTVIKEFRERIVSYKIQYYNNGWKDAFTGGYINSEKTDIFEPVSSDKVRLLFTSAETVPSIYEFEIYAPQADLDNDGQLNLDDLEFLAAKWLRDVCSTYYDCYNADLNSDETVNFQDFAEFEKAKLKAEL